MQFLFPTPMQSARVSRQVAERFPTTFQPAQLGTPPTGGEQAAGPLSAAVMPQPMGNPPTGGEQATQGNYFTRLFDNPRFMQGLTVLGEGLSGASIGQALGRSQAIKGSMTKQREEEERRRKWAQMFTEGNAPVLQGVPREQWSAIQALGPDEGRKVLGRMLLQRGQPAKPDPAMLEYMKTRAREQAKVDVAKPEAQSKAASALQALDRKHSVVEQEIDRALSNYLETGIWPETGIFSALSFIPGTSAYDLSTVLQTIRANIGFDQLQQMRDASPTGGALGNVTERELSDLQSVMGSLAQGQEGEQLAANLRRLRDTLRQHREARRAAYQRDFGALPSSPSSQPSGGVDFRYNTSTGRFERAR